MQFDAARRRGRRDRLRVSRCSRCNDGAKATRKSGWAGRGSGARRLDRRPPLAHQTRQNVKGPLMPVLPSARETSIKALGSLDFFGVTVRVRHVIPRLLWRQCAHGAQFIIRSRPAANHRIRSSGELLDVALVVKQDMRPVPRAVVCLDWFERSESSVADIDSRLGQGFIRGRCDKIPWIDRLPPSRPICLGPRISTGAGCCATRSPSWAVNSFTQPRWATMTLPTPSRSCPPDHRVDLGRSFSGCLSLHGPPGLRSLHSALSPVLCRFKPATDRRIGLR